MFPSKYYIDTGHTHRADDLASVPLPPPDSVCLPMSQHVGLPAVPVVKISEEVCRGQVIGESAPNGLSLPVHSPISGRVKAIEVRTNSRGRSDTFVVIENDFQDETVTNPLPASADEILGAIREAGIVGMGGAAFPTHVKLSSGLGKVDTIIVNICHTDRLSQYTSLTQRALEEGFVLDAYLIESFCVFG